MKTKKINYRLFIIPLFIIITANLIVSIFLSASTTSNTNNNLYTANNLAVNPDKKQLSSIELFTDAYKNLNNAKNVTIKSSGEITSIGKQTINLTKVYDGATYFLQSIVAGLKSSATRIYYSGQTVTKIIGTDIGNNTANWNGKVTNYTLNEFLNIYTLNPSAHIPYDINPLSVISGTDVDKTPDGNYNFTISLHSQLAVKSYAKNLKATLKLKSEPEFKQVTLNVTLDSSLNFSKIDLYENYNVKIVGVNKNCTTSMSTTFNFDKKAIVPKTNKI